MKKHPLIWRIASLFLPLSAMLIIGSLILGRVLRNNRIDAIEHSSNNILDVKRKLIANSLRPVLNDVVYLVKKSYSIAFTPESINELSQDLLNFSKGKTEYYQIRFIDSTGKELIRVYQEGLNHTLNSGISQNKSHRAYFNETIKLSPNQIYLSQLDLNVENNQIEIPFQPVIRCSAPVFSENQEKLGMIIINYKLERVADFIDRNMKHDHNFYLLNQDGYFLYHPQREFEFGFMKPEWALNNFQNQFPKAWQQLNTEMKPAPIADLGMFVFSHFDQKNFFYQDPGFNELGFELITKNNWTMVEQIPEEKLDIELGQLRRNLILFNTVFVSLIFLVSCQIGWTSTKRIENAKKLREKQRELRNTSNSLKRRNIQLGDFNHILAHNLRAPVTSLKALVSLLDKTTCRSDDLDALRPRFKEMSATLDQLVVDLQMATEVVQNDSIKFEEMHLATIIEETRKYIIKDGEQNFDVIVDAQAWDTIEFPRIYLLSIIENLLSNAIKFQDEVKQSFIRFYTTIEGVDKVLVVEDNGVGIDLAKHGHNMFRLYKRFHRGMSGKGLGLFMVKNQLESAGAAIRVESKVGIGTRFIITFIKAKTKKS